jgi:mono/diheme cytochrome c family protein
MRLHFPPSLRRLGAPTLALAALFAAWEGPPTVHGEPAEAAPTWSAVGAVFERACTHCHGSDRPVAGLGLHTRAATLRGSDSGAVVVAKDPTASRLVKHLRGTLEPRMPFDGDALPEAEIALVEQWIAAGAPDDPPPAAPAAPPTPAPAAPAAPVADEPLRFPAVAPILKRACVRCHQERGLRGPAPEGLRLTDLAQVLAGGERLAVLPGRPEASPLARVLHGRAEKRMPLDGPPWLPEADAAAIERWIREGARDAEGRPAPVPVGRRLRLVGTWEAGDRLDGVALVRGPRARVEDDVRVGARVEARLVVGEGGRLEIERLRAR